MKRFVLLQTFRWTSVILLVALAPLTGRAASDDPPSESLLMSRIDAQIALRPGVFPEEVRPLRIEIRGEEAVILLPEAAIETVTSPARFERLVQGFVGTIHPLKRLTLRILLPDGEVSVEEFLPPRTLRRALPRAATPDLRPVEGESTFPFAGALSGKRIVVSPGHGWYWVASLGGWYTQRGETYGVIEDFSNWRIGAQVITLLEHAGSTVYSCRERDFNTTERIVNDDSGAPAYTDGSGWWTSEYTGYAGGHYRARETGTGPDLPEAFWTLSIPNAQRLAVYVFYRAGTNRVSDARYTIHHAGGTSRVRVNQKVNDQRWLYLGTYLFDPASGTPQGVSLSPTSQETGYVIADAVRFGGGMGSIARSGAPSGKPRWQEAARYWVQYVGAPSDAYNASMADDDADVTTRPKYANWQGADAYLSIHSNAYGSGDTGHGTETYMYNGDATEGSEAWRNKVHQRIVQAIRSEWAPSWVDRGLKSANFGELRELDAMPGCLTEIAFHDSETDAAYLKRPLFRQTIARAVTKAAFEFFGMSAPLLPLPVRLLRALPPGPGRLRLMWEPTSDPTWPEAVPASYRIYVSKGGEGFDNGGLVTSQLYHDFTGLEPGELYAFRVSAVNAGGESLPSEPLAVRLQGEDPPQILLVNGFDRLDRSIQEEDNPKTFALLHARAIRAAGDYYFVSATNEAVEAGLVELDAFEMIDWIGGEEARLPGEWEEFTSFSGAEQTRLSAFSALPGKGLFVSGSEIGWDMAESYGAPAGYLAFYTNILKARYVSDDAAEYGFSGVAGGIFDGLSGSFDDGTHGAYNVDWPDVIEPAGGSALCATYAAPAKGLGVCREGGVYLGVPFETLYPESFRNEVMARVLAHLATEGRPPFATEDGDADSADGDPEEIDGEGEADWQWDVDFDIPPDGDRDFMEAADRDLKPDPEGEIGLTDGDDAPSDGENGEAEPADGDEPPLDGDATETDRADPDEDEDLRPADEDHDANADRETDGDLSPPCGEGTEWNGTECVAKKTGGGGCAGTPDASIGFLLGLGLLLQARRRRASGGKRKG